jgi:hypothetical protein
VAVMIKKAPRQPLKGLPTLLLWTSFINNPDLVERFKNDWPLSEDLKTDLFYSADEKDILIIRFIIHCSRMITPINIEYLHFKKKWCVNNATY